MRVQLGGPRHKRALLLVRDLRLAGCQGSLSLDTARPVLTMGLQKGRKKRRETGFSPLISLGSSRGKGPRCPLCRVKLEMIFPSSELTVDDLSRNEAEDHSKVQYWGH